MARTGEDFALERCSDKAYEDLVVPQARSWFLKGLCLKNPDRVSFSGNYALEKQSNFYLGIYACNPKKRKSCKSREEIGRFLKDSFIYILNQYNIVNPDLFEVDQE